MAEDRIRLLDERVRVLEEEFKEIKDGLLGTMSEQGLKALIIKTNDTVVTMKQELSALTTSQRTILDERLQIKGMIFAVGLLCGLISFIASKL